MGDMSKFMKSATRALLALILVWAVGCINSHRREIVYTSPAPAMAATSARPVERVYVTPPAGVSGADLAVANSISELVREDPRFANGSSGIAAAVREGVVTLRGSVPNEGERDEIVGAISKLPGVARVEDQLHVPVQ
jgi:osmotically-inducible protein OsmY